MVQAFRSPTESLGGLDAGSVAALLAVAADVALVLDGDGVVRDMAMGSEALARDLGGDPRWLGQPWAESVAEDSRDKVAALLRDANSGHAPRWRHVNHPSPVEDASVPVLYAAVGLGRDASGGGERIIAFGRDQRLVASLHQRLVEAQGSLERDYARLRHAEARYRLLFQMSAEAALVLDGSGQRVLEANPAADRFDGAPAKGWSGRAFLDAFDRTSQAELASVLAEARFAGRPAEGRGRLARGGDRDEVTVSASPFRQEGAALLLVRLLPAGEGAGARTTGDATTRSAETPAAATARGHLLRLAEAAPDGFVVAGGDGRIVAANPAFLSMAQLGAEDDAVGESLDRWLGRPGLESEVLLANLRTRGAVRLFPTTMRGEHGTLVEAEVSATPLGDPATSAGEGPQPARPPLYGFAIRDVGARMNKPAPAGPPLPRPVEQLTELVGRVPLKDLVREATDVIERLAIEAALELAEDNRASAAEMLGLSRQSLYVKLRRYGLGGDAPAGAGADEG